MTKPIYLDDEFLKQEEKEAQEAGLTVFQLRRVKKMRIRREKKLKAYWARRRKETKDKKERQVKIKLKEKERKIKELEKEKLKRKVREERRKEKEKQKIKEILGDTKPIKKRPVGRPKKRGRKKIYKRKPKNVEVVIPKRVSWPYKIVACKNGKQISYIGKYVDIQSAYDKINELLKKCDDVVFPSLITQNDKITDSKYEYLILERKNGDDKVVYLRNDIGKMVEQKTNSNIWNVYDKFEFKKEETFWVWGYNNKTDRKTFMWIYENILLKKTEGEYDILRVMLYKNKIVFKDDNNDLDVIFCKNISDAIRFYNMLEKMIKENKYKKVFFLGQYDDISDKRRSLEDDLIKLTGWTKKKIQMTSTTHHIVS